jgi:hypothetical protein
MRKLHTHWSEGTAKVYEDIGGIYNPAKLVVIFRDQVDYDLWRAAAEATGNYEILDRTDGQKT